MKQLEVLNRKRFNDIFLFTILISVKVLIFHYNMDLGQNLIFITIKNVLTIFAVYCLATVATSKRREGVYLAINFTISTILFIDAMYYSHFYTLIPFHSIFLVGQLGPVSDSIFSLVKATYLLLFIDCAILLFRYKYKNWNITDFKRSDKRLLSYICLIMIVVSGTMTARIVTTAQGIYTPHNLGVVNYHLYDGLNFFFRTPFDIERAEALIPVVGELDHNRDRGFGIGKGKNLIVIQAESVQNFVINREIDGQQITPNLNKLVKDNSIYFSKYYEQVGWGNTSDAEFISNNGYYPSTKVFSYRAYEGNDFYSLPMALKEKGYSTIAFHGNEAGFWNRENIYPNQGIDEFISMEDFKVDDVIGIGLSDESMFRQSIDFLKDRKEPFYALYVTLTSHHPFLMEEEHLHLNIEEPYKDTLLDHYLQSVHYLDMQVGLLVELLKEQGLYEDTIIAIYGDHQGLNMLNEEANQLMTSYLGEPYEEDEMFRVPLLVHIPRSGVNKEIKIAGGQIDFFPTIANILGIKMDTVMNFGKDLLNTSEGFVAKQINVTRGSFIDNDVIFIMSPDGIFENSRAWNIDNKEPVDLERCRSGYERALVETGLAEYIMQNNLIQKVREKGMGYLIEEYRE